MTEVGFCEIGGSGFCGCKVSEGDEELVFYCPPIIQEGADDGLDSFDTGVVQWGSGVRRVDEFLFDAINYGCVAKGIVLRFLWDGVAPFKKEVFNVILDGQATCALRVVPGDIDASE